MDAERRHALIVATARYDDPRLRQLRAPAADAERLAEVLRDPAKGDFEVDVLLDETQATLTRRIARFFADRLPGDLLLLHFSCHGVKDDRGELYLAARDTELDLLSATGVSAAWLNDQIDRTRSRRTVVLLDCCFSGSFPFGMRARAGMTVNARDHFEGRGRAIITASSGLEYAYEGDRLEGEGRPSVFTEAVVHGLDTGEADVDHDQLVSVDDLYAYVYDRVRETTPSQTPNKKSEIQGPLYLARSTYRPPVEPASLDPELLARTEDRYAGIRLGAVQELAQLLGSRDEGVALAARQALAGMVDDDSRQVSASAGAALAGTAEEPPEVRPPTRRRTAIGAGLAILAAAVAAAILVAVSGGGPAPKPASRYATLLGLVPRSIRPSCRNREHWMVEPGQAQAQTTCPGRGYDLTYGLWPDADGARAWVGTARDAGSLDCAAATMEAMKRVLPNGTTGCQDKARGTQRGIDLWWNERGARVAAQLSWPERDQHAAIAQWRKLVTAS